MRPIPRTLRIAAVAVAVVTVATVAVLGGRGGPNALATGDPSGDLLVPNDWPNGLPTCASGFTTVVYLEPFLAGGVNPNASDNAEGAAQKFLDEYLRLGRHDGAPVGDAELKRHDALAFSVVSLEDSEHAKLAFKVEEVGGRFAVGVLWGCDGSLPRWEQEQSD